METIKPKRYESLDGVRAFAALGIVLMHVLLNGGYKIGAFLGDTVIASFGELVYLFMIVSAFSMCCGYYGKISGGKITPADFYGKRFAKIFPFFALMCLLDFAASPSLDTAAELFADLTLCFGLLPNANISVIGVGWFIGLIFVFYIVFPFFCFLIKTKKRALGVFALCIVFNLLCVYYFFNKEHTVNFDYRSNIVYCSPYFLAGGIIYLYRDSVAKWAKRLRIPLFVTCLCCAALFFRQGSQLWTALPLFALITVYAVGNDTKILHNKVTAFFSSISMEIYLCHMMFYKLIEKAGLAHLAGSDTVSYIITASITFVLATAFSFAVKKIFSLLGSKFICKKN
ncbi:MAG: acyltransferase [Ruminococcaceae bacterium]|nr:acyltransferase [Oscillospiraceae bacterium]